MRPFTNDRGSESGTIDSVNESRDVTPVVNRFDEPEIPARGPVRPDPEVRAAMQSYVESDQTRLGEVFRFSKQGMSPDEIATALGLSTSNFVWNYTRMAGALVDGDLPSAPTVALGIARKFRKVLRDRTLTPAVRRYLELNLEELERRADDPEARSVEVEAAERKTLVVESRNDRGIYVYALPHYLRHPIDPTSGHTLMKVGRSDSDVIVRFRNQTRTTALPEEPILLRVYRARLEDFTPQLESTFHRLLEAAAHSRNVARTAGREWFVTSTRFLDEIARALQLDIDVVNDYEASDDD